MAVLDMTIVNASLPVIQGEIGATPSEGTWIGTSYLIAEICIIPLTAWLTRLLGLRRLMMICVFGFTAFSIACGLSTDLTTVVLARVGQGLMGASLIPSSFAIVMTRLPPSQQAAGMGMSAATALFGPILGPLIGGWITESLNWHYAFFMNVPICVLVITLLVAGLPKSKEDWLEFRNADWFGVIGMMMALGCLTALLEEGHRRQWFESALIWQLALASIGGCVMVGIGQVKATTPVLKLALLRNPGLAAPMVLQLTMGAMLFSTLFTIPQFLAAVAGYNAFQAGQVIFVTGASAIVGAALYPILIKKFDARVIVCGAFVILSMASYMSTHLTAATVGAQFLLAQLFLGAGLTLASIPQHQAAMTAAGPDDATATSSFLVIARNLGGSVGLAAIAPFREYRLELHHWQLQAALGANDLAPQQYLSQLAAGLGGGSDGMQAAYRMLDGQVMLQATVMTFNDVFLMLSVCSLAVAPLVVFMRPFKAGGASSPAAH